MTTLEIGAFVEHYNAHMHKFLINQDEYEIRGYNRELLSDLLAERGIVKG